MPELLRPVLLVPRERRRNPRAVDAERIENDAVLRPLQGYAEDAYVAIADGAHLELVHGGLGHVERPKRRCDPLASRRDANYANAVDEDVERTARRLFEVEELRSRGLRGHVGPRTGAVLTCKK